MKNYKETIKKITLESYDEAITTYINNVKENNVVESIYQISDIKAPGISDIDFVVVIKDNASPQDVHALSINNIDAWRGMFLHEPIVVSRQVLEHIHLLLPIYSLVGIKK